MSRKIFIAHLHEDGHIARIVKRHLQRWSVRESDIFCSSDEGTGATIGDSLETALRTAASEAKLIILIYTTSDKDWSYPMWEVGLTMEPTTLATRLVVLQCGKDQPRVFKEKVRVTLDRDATVEFARQFHTTEGFLRGEAAYDAEAAEFVIKERGESLFRELSNAAPTGMAQVVPRWPMFKLRFEREAAHRIERVTTEQDAADVLAILKELAIVDEPELLPFEHFGFRSGSPVKFAELILRWDEEFAILGENEKPTEEWALGLALGIWRSVQDRPPMPISKAPLKSVANAKWYHPIVTAIRETPGQACELSIMLFEASSPAPRLS